MSKTATEFRVAARAAEIVILEDRPPEWVQLLKMGANARRDGARPAYLVADRAHAERIVAASDAYRGSTDALFDYDHQSEFGAKDGVGGRAPASGWIKQFDVRDDGIYGRVEWTAAASAAILAKEYRYTSPVFGHAKDGRVTRIFTAALTNRPELELRAVASQSDTFTSGASTLDKDLIAALGLADGATDADILAAVTTLVGDRTAVCSALGLAAGAKADEIRTAASQASRVDPAKFVPIAEVTSLRARIDAIDEERVAASVAAATEAGKILPTAESQAWATDYAKTNPAGFAKYVAMTPEIVADGAEQRRAAAIAGGKLTDEQRVICSAQGLNEEDFLATLKETAK